MKQLNTIILVFIAYVGQAQQYSYADLDSLIEWNLKEYNYELADRYAKDLENQISADLREAKEVDNLIDLFKDYQYALEKQIKTSKVLGKTDKVKALLQEALYIELQFSAAGKDLNYYNYIDYLVENYFSYTNCDPSKDFLIKELLSTYQGIHPNQKDAQYWSIIAMLADFYYCSSRYLQALGHYQDLQKYNQQYTRQIGLTYEALGNYPKALEFLEPLLQNGTEDEELKESLRYVYEQIGDTAKAEAIRATLAYDYEPLSMSFDVLDSLMKASRRALNYDLAVRYAELKEEKALMDYNKNHPVYQKALLDLAYLYGFVKRYEQVTLICWEVLDIQLKLSGGQKDEAYLDKVKEILGKNYQGERVANKDLFLQEAMEVYEVLYTDRNSSTYVDLQNKLGKWYFKQGKYPKAVVVYEQLTEMDARYAVGLSRVYLSLGRYEEAEELLRQVKNDRSGKDLVLLEIYETTAQYEKLIKLCEKLIAKRPFQKRRWLSIMGASYTALGYTIFAYESYEKALKLYQESPEFEATFDSTAAMSMMGDDIYKVGLLYANLGDYKEAQRWFNKVLEIYPSTYPEHRNALRKLFLEHWNEGEEQLADSLILEINKNTIYLLEEYYPQLSEDKRLDFYKTVEQDIELCYSYASQKTMLDSTLARAVQDLSLITKNLSLQNTERFLTIISNQKDSTLMGVYYEWIALRRRIVEAMASSKDDLLVEKVDLKQLFRLAEEKETELGDASAAFAETMNQQKVVVTSSMLKNKLSENAVAIDFLSFRTYQNGKWGKDLVYYALITRKDWTQPKLISLSTQTKLNIFLEKEVNRVGQNYIADNSLNGVLYTFLWLQLKPYLNGIKTVHLCPTGLLNKVAFGALRNPLNNRRLLEEYELHYYGNLRDFVLEKRKFSTKKITLFGGINFYGNNGTEWADFRAQKRDFTQGYAFNLLSGTYQETETINSLFREKGWSADWFTADKATEELLRGLTTNDAAPSILHIATHGFFFTKTNQTNQNSSTIVQNLYAAENPLFRSGLAFAGINKTWVDGESASSDSNGILTAYEVAGLDLHQTELVVLSACETGRGDIDKNEGVMGLQRAFKLAGAEQLIISLWKVPDEQTATLMELFYDYYLNGLPIAKAFRQAQLDLQRSYPNPYYWAAFVLME